MIDESNHLCDRIQRLIDDAVVLVTSEAMAEKRSQLCEITSTIESLDRKNISVPQELLDLQRVLSEQVTECDTAMNTLKSLNDRIVGLLGSITPHIRERIVRHRTRRLGLPQVTPTEEFHPVITDILRKLGGSGSVHQVLDSVFDSMKDRLLPGDFELYPNSNCENWRRSAKIARYELINSGVMRADSPRKTWELNYARTKGEVDGDD